MLLKDTFYTVQNSDILFVLFLIILKWVIVKHPKGMLRYTVTNNSETKISTTKPIGSVTETGTFTAGGEKSTTELPD